MHGNETTEELETTRSLGMRSCGEVNPGNETEANLGMRMDVLKRTCNELHVEDLN